MTAPRRPIEAGEPHAALASAGDGQERGPLRRAHLGAPAVMRGSPLLVGRFASSGCWRGHPAVRQGGQQSRKSPDSVRFLRHL